MHDLNYKFVTASGILHETLVDIVGILAIKHPLHISNFKDPGEALAEVLSKTTNLENSAPSLANKCNKEYIFTTQSVVKSKIIIADLDTTLLVEIILRVDGFLTNRNTRVLKGKCTEQTHKKNATCCDACNHACPCCSADSCKSKKIRTCCKSKQTCCTGKNDCSHECTSCEQKSKDCTSNRKICCDTCKICIYCSKLLLKLERCGILILRESINTIRSLRNLLSHATDENYKNLENNAKPFPDFKHCTTWYEMWNIYYETLEDCLSYLCSENFIKKADQEHRLGEMQNVRNFSLLDLQKQCIDYFTKMSNFISKTYVEQMCEQNKEQHDDLIKQNEEQHDDLIKQNEEQHDDLIKQNEEQHDDLIKQNEEQNVDLIKQNKEQHDDLIKQNEEQHDDLIKQNEEQHDDLIKQNEEQNVDLIKQNKEQHDDLIKQNKEQHDDLIKQNEEQNVELLEKMEELKNQSKFIYKGQIPRPLFSAQSAKFVSGKYSGHAH